MFNLRDFGIKLFWTAAATTAGFVAVFLADPANGEAWWAALGILAAQAVLSIARQKLGAVPPDLEVTKAAGVAPGSQ